MKSSINILIIIFFTSCSVNKKNDEMPLKLKIDSIESVFIKKNLSGTDSIKLTKSQIESLTSELNNSQSMGLYKMIPKYWVTVKLKNDTIRKFRINGELIKEHGDWSFSMGDSTLIESFWKPKYTFPTPEDYTPLTFLNFATQTLPGDSLKLKIVMSMTNEFPTDWVKEEHLEKLFQLLDSKEQCGCFLNPLSSYIPTGSAEKGGYAGIFIKAFKEGKKVNLGLYSCPEVNPELNQELKKWRKERKE